MTRVEHIGSSGYRADGAGLAARLRSRPLPDRKRRAAESEQQRGSGDDERGGNA